MAVPMKRLKPWLARLKNDNAQGEYYLTDVVALAVHDGAPVVAVKAPNQTEVDGVNSPIQLAALERAHQRREAERLMEAGVRIADPARFDLRGTLECGQDVEVDVNCIFEGRVNYGAGSITANYDGANKHQTIIGADVHVGSNCVLVAPVKIGDGGTVGAGSVITKDTPAGALSIARGKQVAIANWQRPKKGAK